MFGRHIDVSCYCSSNSPVDDLEFETDLNLPNDFFWTRLCSGGYLNILSAYKFICIIIAAAKEPTFLIIVNFFIYNFIMFLFPSLNAQECSETFTY